MQRLARFDLEFCVEGSGGNLRFNGQWDTPSDTKRFLNQPVRVLNVSESSYLPVGKVVYPKGKRNERYLLAAFQTIGNAVLFQALPITDELPVTVSNLTISKITGLPVQDSSNMTIENIYAYVNLMESPSKQAGVLNLSGLLITNHPLKANQKVGDYVVVSVTKKNEVYACSVASYG